MMALVITVYSLPASGQKDSSGIYLTATDFRQGKLSYAINYTIEKHKIKDNLLFNESEVKVKHRGNIYALKKKDIYGYRDTKGIDFRFLDNKACQVLNKTDKLILYELQTPTSIGGKGNFKFISTFYFSKDIQSTPQPLTKANLKAAYPGNHKFHDALEVTFKDDNDLSAFDSFHNKFKVVHVLEMNQ